MIYRAYSKVNELKDPKNYDVSGRDGIIQAVRKIMKAFASSRQALGDCTVNLCRVDIAIT